MKYHTSVLIDTIIDYLDPAPGKVYIDCTLGMGGHTERLLEKGAKVYGIDCDEEVIEIAKKRLAPFSSLAQYGTFIPVNDNFSNILNIIEKYNIEPADGILFDLGVSSYQLEREERGFSFMKNGPLDMRMSKRVPVTASELIKKISEDNLTKLIFAYGEDRWAKKISRTIVSLRKSMPINTTRQLSELIARAVPKNILKSNIHPATRTFQALRIAVNDELENLEKGLSDAVNILKKDGRIAVISFNSLEDRIVKHFFLNKAKGCICLPSAIVCVCGGRKELRIMTKKPVVPDGAELDYNRSSRSAKLRVAVKL